MASETDRLGSYVRHGDAIDVTFERYYPRTREAVWRALTDPERLADWMGQCFVEPYVGGRYETMLDGLKPMRGIVRVWDPPRLLEYDWHNGHAPNAIARWELAEAPAGTLLTFRQSGIPYANTNLMMPGWHVYLHHLAAVLDGVAPADFERLWREQQEIYSREYGLGSLTTEP